MVCVFHLYEMARPLWIFRENSLIFIFLKDLNNYIRCKAVYTLLLDGTYSAHTHPGWSFKSKKSLDLYIVDGIISFCVKKYSLNLWFTLSICQSHQILSTNTWCKKNSGVEAESMVHIVPPMTQWTKSWNSILKRNSKFSKSDGFALLMMSCLTATASGALEKNSLVKHPPPALGIKDHTSSRNGPVSTHPLDPVPLPPIPWGPGFHTSLERGSTPKRYIESNRDRSSLIRQVGEISDQVFREKNQEIRLLIW